MKNALTERAKVSRLRSQISVANPAQAHQSLDLPDQKLIRETDEGGNTSLIMELKEPCACGRTQIRVVATVGKKPDWAFYVIGTLVLLVVLYLSWLKPLLD